MLTWSEATKIYAKRGSTVSLAEERNGNVAAVPVNSQSWYRFCFPLILEPQDGSHQTKPSSSCNEEDAKTLIAATMTHLR